MSGGEFDGRQGTGLWTHGDGVQISDRSGREVFLRWVDAIAIARDVLTAAQARGLTADARRPDPENWILQLHGTVLTPQEAEELIAVVRSRVMDRSETHGDWSGDEPAG